MLVHLETEDFNELVGKGLVLVDFYAEWCGPCKMLGPVLEDLASSREDIKVVKVDVDKHDDLARQYSIMSVPTMFLMKDGDIKKTLVGFLPKEVINDELNKLN